VNGYTPALPGSQIHYASIWEKSSGLAWRARHGMPDANYQTEFDQNVKDGYRLKLVNGYTLGNWVFYATIWEKSSGPTWIAQHGIAAANYQTEFDKHVKDGYRLKLVSGYTLGSQDFYAMIWEKSSGPDWTSQAGIAGADYQTEFGKHVKDGYRLIWVSGYGD
jgi:Polyglycine hydrolase-like, structural repeat